MDHIGRGSRAEAGHDGCMFSHWERTNVEGLARDNSGYFAVRDGVVAMEHGKENGAGNSGSGGPDEVPVERSGGVPRAGETVTLSGVAMAIDNHRNPCP